MVGSRLLHGLHFRHVGTISAAAPKCRVALIYVGVTLVDRLDCRGRITRGIVQGYMYGWVRNYTCVYVAVLYICFIDPGCGCDYTGC